MRICLNIEEIGLEIADDLEEKEDLIWADVCELINQYFAEAHEAIAEVVDDEFNKRGVKYEY